MNPFLVINGIIVVLVIWDGGTTLWAAKATHKSFGAWDGLLLCPHNSFVFLFYVFLAHLSLLNKIQFITMYNIKKEVIIREGYSWWVRETVEGQKGEGNDHQQARGTAPRHDDEVCEKPWGHSETP